MNNEIQYLSENAFYGLSSLEILLLGSNHLQSIPSDTFAPFAISNSLRYLDLSFNYIAAHHRIRSPTLSNVPSLNQLDLSGNKMLLPNNWRLAFHNFSEIILDGVFDYSLEFGSIIWSDEPILSVKTLQYKNVGELNFRTKMCFLLPNLERAILSRANIKRSLESLDLPKCPHLKELDLYGSISLTGFKQTQITVMLNLVYLNMGGNNMLSANQVLFIKAPLLTTLDLSNNNIQEIDEELSSAYPNLANLNLESNAIVSIEGIRNLAFLRNLNMAKNQMTTVPAWFISKAENALLETLDLSQNPFQCSCSIEPFRKWILSNRQTRLLQYLYACASPDALKQKSILDIELDCRSHIGFYLSFSIPLFLLVCGVIILMVKYQWHIRYKLFLLYRNYNCIPENNNNDFEMVGNMEYHAYIAYDEDCRQDEDWILNDLQPNMEDGPEPLRLCIKRRDFVPGRPIIDTIYENIQRSFKTIAVLTPHFADSEWCYYEMQMAQMRLFQENRDVLILVLLEDIPGNKLTMALRQLLCKKQYLVWPDDRIGQRLFWQRLRAEIKEPVRRDRRYDV